MTPLVDDLTAVLISVLFVLIAIITIYEARRLNRPGEIVTGLAAIMVSAVYSMPVLFDISVLEIRAALRAALIVYGLNYTISHRQVLVTVVRWLSRKLKTWNFQRS